MIIVVVVSPRNGAEGLSLNRQMLHYYATLPSSTVNAEIISLGKSLSLNHPIGIYSGLWKLRKK